MNGKNEQKKKDEKRKKNRVAGGDCLKSKGE